MFGLLLLAFVVVPLVELWIVLQVADGVGIPETIALLLIISLAGAWLVRVQGWSAVRRVQDTMQQGRMPTTELVDGALIVVAGALLLTPGFLTDAVGFGLLLPPTRAIVRRALIAYLRTRFGSFGIGVPYQGDKGSARRRRRSGASGDVIDVDLDDVAPGGDGPGSDPASGPSQPPGPIELGP